MNTKVANAVERLNKMLPLARRQQGLDRKLADVYQAILYGYVQQGASLNRDEITRQVSDIDEAISIQQRNREILNSDRNSDVYFGISWNSTANNFCATSLCTEMLFLKGKQIADQWQAVNAENREILDVQDAGEFFVPLMTYKAA